MTAIEWADKTWNPITGCVKVSPGCKHCYAERIAKSNAQRFNHGIGIKDAFKPVIHESRIWQPRGWRKSKVIFVCSMSDLFQEAVDAETLHRIFVVMEQCEQHLFLVLTKRAKRMRNFMEMRYKKEWFAPRNIWCGVSCESNDYLERVENLVETPAAKRFVSFEPLLGKLDRFDMEWFYKIDWAIVGGESGKDARPMELDWPLHIRNMILAGRAYRVEGALEGWREPYFKTAFFFKQWGGKRAKSGGRTLEGREWNDMPELPLSVREARDKPAKPPAKAQRNSDLLDYLGV